MSEDSSQEAVIALAADLMFAARLRGTAQTVGANLTLVRNEKDLFQRARELAPRQIIIDLDTRGLDPVALIASLKADPELKAIPILAFVSHVREDAIAGARAAGAERVIARGAFVKNLTEILAGK